MYDKTKEQLVAVIYPERICANTIYELKQDKNLEHLIYLLKEKYLENKNVFISSYKIEEYFDILGKLFEAVFRLFKKYTAEEVIKCCGLFPDYGGKNFMYLVGIMVILEEYFIIKRLEELEGTKKSYEEEKPEWVKTFNEKRKKGLFIKEKEFIDENKYLEYINETLKTYNKKEHTDKLKKLLKIANNEENLITIGELYWQNKKENHETTGQKLKDSFDKILNIINDKNKE